MILLRSEWDIGENSVIFASIEAGARWLHKNSAIAELAEADDLSVEIFIAACFDGGYLSWKTLELIE
jgi:hypothetical protein